jgi:hypothetical protein
MVNPKGGTFGDWACRIFILSGIDHRSDDCEPEPGFGPLRWVSWILLLVPCLYVLSMGPVVAVAGKNPASVPTIRAVYSPVIWLHEHTPLKQPLEMYAKLWGWS